MRKFEIYLQASARLALLIGLGLTFLSPMHAQTFLGSVVGTVTDTSGAVVPGATVTLTNVATNEKHSTSASAVGNYEFVNLVPATYRVDVEAASFKHFVRQPVPVEVNMTTRADAKLEVGAASETVQVSSSAVMLQTDSGTLSSTVVGQQVQEMPLSGRNVMNLLELVPGVMPNNPKETQVGLDLGGSVSSPPGWAAFTINGGDNMEYLDGAPLNLLQGNNIALVPTQDSVQEFGVNTNSYSADTGRATGGVANFTSKSGTNSWHGSAYEYFRNTDLNANNYFSNLNGTPNPEWNQNQYGITIGLPIKKNKLFFFGSWEAFNLLTAIPTSTNVPTQAMQNGTFTRQITDPRAPGDGCVITQNAVPTPTWTLGAGCLDPTAQVMKTFYGLPNSSNPADNYFINELAGNHYNQLNVRVDYDISPRQRLFAHVAWWADNDKPTVPFPNPIKQWNLEGDASFFTTNVYILGDTITVSPKTVIDVRAINLRFTYYQVSPLNNVDLGQFGSNWAVLNTFVPAGNHWFPALSFGAGGAVHNLFSLASNTIGGNGQIWDTYGVNGSVTHVVGRHSLKIGEEARLMDLEQLISGFNTGNPAFGLFFTQGNGACPVSAGCGDEWAEFLMGYFKTASVGGSYGGSDFNYYQAYYAQDSWQATHKLTLNLGVRWELPGGEAERKNNAVVIEPNSVDPYTLAYGTETLVNTPAYRGRSVFPVRYDLVNPRVGFAYRLDNSTVVRGGYGITNQSADLDGGGSGAAGAPVNSATSTSTNATGTPVIAPTQFLQNPIPQGVVQPLHRSNPAFMETLMQNAQASGGFSMSAFSPYMNIPYIQQWNFTIQRQVKNSFQTSVTYAGSHMVKGKAGGLIDEIPASAYTVTTTGTAAPGVTGSQVPTQTAAAANGPYAGANLVAKVPVGPNSPSLGKFCTPNSTVCNSNWLVGQSLQPYPNYTNATISNLAYGNIHYNALQVQSQLRLKGAGEVGASYTWAKTIGDGGTSINGSGAAGIGYQDIYNHRADRSVTGVPMRLALNYVLPLPFGQGQAYLHFSGVADKIVSGWQFTGITSFQHGGYLSIGNNSSNLLNKNFGANTTRANYVPGGYTVINGTTYNCNSKKTLSGSAVARINEWFNVGCFQYPGDYTYGNENANDPQLFAQGQDNWDIGMLKSTKATEGVTVQFRAEAFNVFNRVQFSGPNTSVGNANYGKVTAQANNSRLLQLSLRVSF